MIKIIFLHTKHSPEESLKVFSKMTPGRSGKWKNLIGVTEVKDADIAVIIDYTTTEIPENMPRIYIGAHPTVCSGYICFDDVKDNPNTIKVFDSRDTFGFGEYWLKYDYDELSTLDLPRKTKNLSCIISNARTYNWHKKRIEWLNEYCAQYPDSIEVYGRIQPTKKEEPIKKHYKGVLGSSPGKNGYLDTYWYGKEDLLKDSRYVLEFDAGSNPDTGECKYYFSERLFDDLLLWSMPIYYGGNEIHNFLPEDSFIYLDIFKDQPKFINYIINSNIREKNLAAIGEARNLLLNKYQLWARIEEAIKGKL